jgi:hypothetical protein
MTSTTIARPMSSTPVRTAAIADGATTPSGLAARSAGIVSYELGLLPRNLDQRRVDLGLAITRHLARSGRDLGEEIVEGVAHQQVLE